MWPFERKKEKQSEPYTVTVGKADEEWTPKDADRLRTFLSSRTGKKLLNHRELTAHRMALDPTRRTDFHDGIRVGIIMDLNTMKELSKEIPEIMETNRYPILHSDYERTANYD